MKRTTKMQPIPELTELCATVRAFVTEGAYESCLERICQAMEAFPHAPHPHNLLGIVLEKTGDHSGAMRHFRAAWALDPAYAPANHNLHTYGTFFSGGNCAFDESDIPGESAGSVEIHYNAAGIGRLVSRTKIEYDRHGIGRVVRR